MNKYKLLASPLKTALDKQQFPPSIALPRTTINMTITTDFSNHSEIASVPEEIIMPKNTSWGSRLTTTKEREPHKFIKKNVT
jgi:hypothetical protein